MIAKCWKCGAWISSDDEYENGRGFHTCPECLKNEGRVE